MRTHAIRQRRAGAPGDPGGGTDAAVPDAILLDLNTPRSEGCEVLIKLKLLPRLSQVPLAILTSLQTSSDRRRVGLQNVALSRSRRVWRSSLPRWAGRSRRC